MNAELHNRGAARAEHAAPQADHRAAGRDGWLERDGIEFEDRAMLVRAVEDTAEPAMHLPILSDEELLSLMDPAKLVLERIPLALLADLVSPFGPDSERLLAEEA